jgi:hypothetical protein
MVTESRLLYPKQIVSDDVTVGNTVRNIAG